MELILKEDVIGLGYKYDTVEVKPGYGRNFLIPQGKAIIASPNNKKIVAENIKQAAHKAEKMKKDALTLQEGLSKYEVFEIGTKVGENGRIFGAITPLQVSDALSKKGFEVDRRRVILKDKNIKEIGEYLVVLDIHKEVKPQITIKIVAE